MFSVFIVVSPFACWLSPGKGKQKRPSSTEKTGYRFDLLGQKSENFCGATQIDNSLSAHDAPARILPCNGGTPSAPTCPCVQPALRSPFGKRLSAALAPSGSSLGEILSAYSSASTVSSCHGVYSREARLSSVFRGKAKNYFARAAACKVRADMI